MLARVLLGLLLVVPAFSLASYRRLYAPQKRLGLAITRGSETDEIDYMAEFTNLKRKIDAGEVV